METQAPGTGASPSPAPVHPVHQETQIHNALTDWVRNNPDNDPHTGTDLEAPKPPEEPAKPEEAKAEPEQESEATLEIDEDTPFFDIEYDGKKEKLTAKQIREGYLAKRDYHRNIQKVKAEESAVQERVKAETLKAQQEYAQRLEVQKQAVARLSGVKSMQEIEALARQDPAAAQQEFLRFVSVSQTLQAIEAEQRQVAQDLQLRQQTALQEAVAKSRAILESDIPGWGEELYQKVLSTISKDYGFDGKEVTQVWDSRLMKVFHDAYKFRSLEKAKPELSKKVQGLPKVIKPGSADKPSPESEVGQKIEAQLKKTGDWRDAAALYLARSKKRS